MDPNALQSQPTDALLRLYCATLEELRRREVVRSSNNPVADYAEKIAARGLSLKLTGKSGAGHDGEDAQGKRYQIKGRRVTPHNKSRELSAIRKLDDRPFDFLVGIVFDAEFRIHRACVVPVGIVQTRASYSKHVNGHRLLLHDDVWAVSGVRDVTAEMTRAADEVCAGACGR